MKNRYTWAAAAALACAAAAAPASPSTAEGPSAVRIGVLLPADAALARETSRGAGLAALLLRVAGTPVEIVERRTRGPWGSEARELVDLVYADRVAGVVTAPERGAAHLAAQVAAKARLPVVTCSPESALTRIPLPWVVRAVHGERAVLASLLAAIPSRPTAGGLAAITDPGREGDRLAGEIARAARRSGWGDPVAGLPGRDAAAVLVAASPAAGGAALRRLREDGFRGTVLLLPGPGETGALLREAGESADGALAPEELDPAAAAFDAVLLLARAAWTTDRSAGRMLDRILAAPPLRGATGPVRLDADGDRVGAVPVRVVRAGREDHP